MGRTAPLTSKRCILYIYSTNIGTEYFKHALYSPFFFSSKCSLFHNANLFGSCIIHILYTGCAKIKRKNKSVPKGLIFVVESDYKMKDRYFGQYVHKSVPHCTRNIPEKKNLIPHSDFIKRKLISKLWHKSVFRYGEYACSACTESKAVWKCATFFHISALIRKWRLLHFNALTLCRSFTVPYFTER